MKDAVNAAQEVPREERFKIRNDSDKCTSPAIGLAGCDAPEKPNYRRILLERLDGDEQLVLDRLFALRELRQLILFTTTDEAERLFKIAEIGKRLEFLR